MSFSQLAELGLEKLPLPALDDRTPRNYRFHIFEDVVRAGNAAPVPFEHHKDLAALKQFYAQSSSVTLYVHTPWCIEECTYCHYWGKMEKRAQMEELCAAERAHAELVDELVDLKHKTVPSIYFGGGTPTVLPASLLEQQLAFFTQSYPLSPGAEICVEGSVGTLNHEKFDILEKYATRLSMGIQSFSDRLLARVARTFSREKATDVLQEAVKRFPSVNIDLIYGLETQTMADWIETIEHSIALGVPSITLYRLEVREEPPLVRAYIENAAAFPDELTCGQMRTRAKELLEQHGYRENLVGWFLKPQVEDTVVYRERWERQTPCIAFGPGVQSYAADHFYTNVSDRDEYLARLRARELPIGPMYRMSQDRKLGVFVIAQWKSGRAIDLTCLEERFGAKAREFVAHAERLQGWNLVRIVEGQAALTEPGKLTLEWILRDFIHDTYGKRSFAGTPRLLPVVA